MTPTQWLVLDNVRQGHPYRMNICDWDAADQAYLWCVANEYIRDGAITDAGRVLLQAVPLGRFREAE